MWWSWKNWFWTVSTFGASGGLERSDFEQFLLWEGGVVLKELILNSFYFGRVWWSWKNWFWTVSTLEGCGGFEITYGRCTGKHWEYTRGCLNIWGCWGHQGHQGCPNAWGHLNIWGVKMPSNNSPKCSMYIPLKKISGVWTYWGVEMDREALGIYKRVLNVWGIGGIRMVCRCMGASKHMGGVQIPQTYGGVKPMPWKKWFWTFSTLGGCGVRCGGLERTDFEQFLLWEGVVVLKELILNSFYFGRVWR